MNCKFRAEISASRMLLRPFPLLRLIPMISLAAALAAVPALAEKADRRQQMVVEADRPGTLDFQRQVLVFNGNVTITQGTLAIHADRVEVRELPDGYREAVALGTAGHPATYRQKRDGVDETVEGQADRIEYDSRADTLRLVGDAAVRRLRGKVVADEISGAQITWDANAELFSVQGAAASSSSPAGRVRVVLNPPAAAASAPAPGASGGQR